MLSEKYKCDQSGKNKIFLWLSLDNGHFITGDDIQSKVLAFAFGLSAEIERNLISQRTKEALARKKAEGVTLGRPKGKISSKVKLSGNEEMIRDLRESGVTISQIASIYHVNRNTVSRFIRNHINSEMEENENV